VSAKVTFAGHDSVVDCGHRETLLRAGLRAGLQLPYECASGGCGSCRAQIVNGEVETLWEDAVGLTERDRRRGNRLLMCQSMPTGDCVIKAPSTSIPEGVEEPAPERFAAHLAGRELLTSDTALFTLELDASLRFLPGQFMLFESDSGIRRAYSMAHPLGKGSAVEFVIRAKPDGAASKWLFEELTDGDALTIEGPYGRAYARPNTTRPVLCVAGGTGLAPILAITEHLLSAGGQPSLHLYVGARADGDLVLLERLLQLRDSGALVSLSAEQLSGAVGDHPLAPVRNGLVIEHVANDWPQLAKHDIYLAGPAGMVDAALRAFVRGGDAKADRVFFDRFIA
jgi:toluene monooxygenase electron transfer component